MKNYLYFCAAALLFISCQTDPALKYPNMIANIDPFQIGSVNASLDRTFSSQLKEVTMNVIFHPRENEVSLEFSNDMSQYQQFWNKAARQLFKEALNRYEEDFSNKNLTTKYNKSRGVYGRVKGKFYWKTLKISSTYRSTPHFELGYRFRNDTPYFSAYQRTAKEESGANRQGISESPSYSIYFTRAQGEELSKLFDDAFLLELIADKIPASTGSDRDEYFSQ